MEAAGRQASRWRIGQRRLVGWWHAGARGYSFLYKVLQQTALRAAAGVVDSQVQERRGKEACVRKNDVKLLWGPQNKHLGAGSLELAMLSRDGPSKQILKKIERGVVFWVWLWFHNFEIPDTSVDV